jgi:hypothetical protein
MAVTSYRDDAVCIRTERNLVLLEWHEAPTMKQLRAYEEALRAVARAHGASQSGTLHVVRGGMPKFDDAVRAWVTKAFTDDTYPHRAIAFAIVAGGLTGAATRAFLSTIRLLTRTRDRVEIFGDLAVAARWVEGRLASTKGPFQAAEILDLFGE